MYGTDYQRLQQALEDLKRRKSYIDSGGVVHEDQSKNSRQWQWRADPERPWDQEEATTAVLDALINQGSIIAWDGDGVSCVVQMIQAQWERAEKYKKELEQIKDIRKSFTAWDR